MSLSTVPTQLKYGLIKKSQSAATKAPVRPKPSAFRDALEEDSGDDEEMSDIGRVNAQLRKKNEINQAKLEAASSSAEVDIYDYDGSYDNFKAAAITSHPLSQPLAGAGEPKSQYVSGLLVTAKMREREKERVYEKKLLKEQKEEDELYGDQPKFITNAYKQKLLEDQKWDYENKLAEKLEESNDVRKKGMHGFYANLLTKNIAMGGNVENALSVYTAGSNRQNKVVNEEQQSAPKNLPSGAIDSSADRDVVPVAKSRDSTALPSAADSSSEHIVATKSSAPNPKPAAPVAASEVSKTEDISSARERYLARKRKLQEESGNA